MMDCRAIRGGHFVPAFFFLVVTFFLGRSTFGQPGETNTSTVLITAPRDYVRQLELAQRAIDSSDNSEAIERLDALLNSRGENVGDPLREDYFVGDSSQVLLGSSIKARLHQMLANMPDAAREAYELHFGADAKLLLAQAVNERNFEKIAEVQRRYFGTNAGFVATMLLGRHLLDVDQPMSAAACFERLATAPSVVQRFGSELFLLRAVSLWRAGNDSQAESVLAELKKRYPAGTFTIRGKEIQLYTDDVPPLEWLEGIFGSRVRSTADRLVPVEWLMHRGNLRRNAESDGSMPLLNLRWRVSMADDPADATTVAKIVKRSREDQKVMIPSLQPVVVNDMVFVRGARQMVGVDLETGKRITEFPWSDPIAFDSAEMNGPAHFANRRGADLTERIWRNAIHGQLSSNGSSLFLIDQLKTDNWQLEAFGNNVFPGVMGARFNTPSDDHNVLVALDIATECKYVWRVGGASGEEEPDLAKVFFLGPPIEAEGELFVLGERNGDTSLYALEPATGRVRWSQQLAHVDPLNSFLYMQRRSAGAIPSFSDGILVCPTTAGAIIAIDRINRTLLWGYQYYDPADLRETRSIMRAQAEAPSYDTSVTIAEGKVLFAAIETGQLLCLDLRTGKLLWKRQDRNGDDLYVAGVHANIVSVVGRKRMTGLNLDKGTDEWKLELASTNSSGLPPVPTGRGFRTQDHYFLPTSNSILKINLLTGKVDASMATDEPLGNLVAYKDQILSLGPEWLTAFYQLDRLSEIVADRLAADPRDAWALEQRGLLLLDQGQRREGLASLRQAMAVYEPDDPRRENTRQLLVDGLLATLEEDFVGNRELVDEVTSLADRTLDRGRLLIVLGNGRLRTGDIPGAFEAFAELVFSGLPRESDSPPRLVESKSRRIVRHDRLVRAGLRNAFESALPEQRDTMLIQLREMKQSALGTGDLSQLLRAIQFFGDHAELDDIRLRVAERFLSQNQLVRAEQVLLPIVDRDGSRAQAAAHLLLGRTFEAASFVENAAECYRIALERWPETVLADGRKVRDVVHGLDANGQVARLLQLTDRSWPFGEVVINSSKANPQINNTDSFLTASFKPFVWQQWTGDLAPRLMLSVERANSIVATDSFGRERFRLPRQIQNFAGNDGEIFTSRSHGGLYVINSGESLVAVSALDGRGSLDSQILWPSNYRAINMEPTFEPARPQTPVAKNPNRWKQIIPRVGEQKISAIGPMTSEGLVYLQSHKLNCVDLLSGELLWSRADVQPQAEVWGDNRYVFVAPVLSVEARVFDVLDGRELETKPIPTKDRRWEYVDRRILTWNDESSTGTWMLRLYDPWTGTDAWQRSFSANSRGYAVAQRLVAVVQRDGSCTVLDMKTGQTLVEDHLELPQRDLHCVYLLPSGDQFIVACLYRFRSQPETVLEPYSESTEAIYDALLFAFDRRTGARQWQSPVTVEKFGLPLDQPSELPTLLFLRRTTPRQTQNQKVDAVCVDRRDGRMLFDAWNQPVNRVGYRVQGDPHAHTIQIRLSTNNSYSLTFTDQPRPPEPPARVVAGSPSGDGFRRLGRAVIDSIFKGIDADHEVFPNIDPDAPEEQR